MKAKHKDMVNEYETMREGQTGRLLDNSLCRIQGINEKTEMTQGNETKLLHIIACEIHFGIVCYYFKYDD